MPHNQPNRRKPATTAMPAMAAVLVLLACLGLAACGGSSKSSSTTAVAAATNATGFAGSTGATGFGRFRALRECLQKNGVTLPKRTPGQPPAGGRGGFFRGGTGATLPNGVSRAQMEAALKKCGAGSGFGLRRLDNPAYRQALSKFATCMREHGVNVPAPNTSGSGPIFNTKGINTKSTQFANAEAACRSALRSASRIGVGGPPQGPGAAGANGSPSGGAEG